MKTHPLLLAAVPAVALAFTACTNSVNSTQRAESVGSRQMVNDRRIISDGDLSDIARIIGVNESTVGGDLLKIQVEVFNTDGDMKTFNYRFEWYDMDGMIVHTPTSIWKQATIEGKESRMLTGVAPNPRAKDFRLKLMGNVRE